MTFRSRALGWSSVVAALLLAGCPGMLPASDRAFDASPETVDQRGDTGTTMLDTTGGPGTVPPADAGVRPPVDVVAPAVDLRAPVDVATPSVDVRTPVDVGTSQDIGVDPPNCGGHGSGGEPCCAAGRCNAGYVCVASACARCGGNREVCCPGDACDGSRDCQDGFCR